MSHIKLANEGLAAVEARQWDEAITKLSPALEKSPNPAWLVARSKALVGLGRFDEALEDAEQAWHRAYDRNKRDVLAEAHYRRAVAYYRLGQLANADCCAIYAMRTLRGSPAVETKDAKDTFADGEGFWTATREDAMDEAREYQKGRTGLQEATASREKDNQDVADWRRASTLRLQALTAIKALPANDAGRKVTVSMKLELKKLANIAASKTAVEPSVVKSDAKSPISASKEPPRLQDFQTATAMNVSVFSKGVDKGELQVQFLPFAVHMDKLKMSDGTDCKQSLHLWGEIDPSASKYAVFASKVELHLSKKKPGKWPQLMSTADSSSSSSSGGGEHREQQDRVANQGTAPKAPVITQSNTGPCPPKPETGDPAAHRYPTSSRNGPKNWDMVGADELGKDNDDDKASDVNQFFKNLYKSATPEQQRAMMKSFTESNGTSLSTDWNDVKTRTVETIPPEGVEAKKWE